MRDPQDDPPGGAAALPTSPENDGRAPPSPTLAWSPERGSSQPTPSAPSQPPRPSRPRKSVPRAPELLRSVMIVDDDPDVLLLWHGGLVSYGVETFAFSSAEEAMLAPELWEVDLLITDLELPGRSGSTLIASIREERPDLPILCVTGSRDRNLIASAYAEGAYDCLFKPCSAAQIVKRAVRGESRVSDGGGLGSTLPGTPYLIDGLLGEGGFGVVYSGVHLDLGRRVAIKMSNQEQSADVARAMLAEARVLQALRGPHIPEVFDFRELSDGRAMMAMEVLEGELLSDRLDRGPLPFASAIRVIDGVLSGLARAHEAEIVHLDIKPANLMFVGAEGDEELKILDFGLANIAGDGAKGYTPGWAAPEQLRQSALDERTDVFACGLLLESLLTGQEPRPRGFSEALLPPELSNTELQAVSWWIGKCRREDPDQRFANARAARKALRQALEYFAD